MKNFTRFFAITAMWGLTLSATILPAQTTIELANSTNYKDTTIGEWFIAITPEGVWWYSKAYPSSGTEVHTYKSNGDWISSSVLYPTGDGLIAIPFGRDGERRIPPVPFERTGLGLSSVIWVDSVYFANDRINARVDSGGFWWTEPLIPGSMVWEGLKNITCRPVTFDGQRFFFVRAFEEFGLGFIFYSDLGQTRIEGTLIVTPKKATWDPDVSKELFQIDPKLALQKVAANGWQFNWPPEKK